MDGPLPPANLVQSADQTPSLLKLTADQVDRMAHAGIFPSGQPSVELRGGLLYRMSPQHVPHMTAKSVMVELLIEAIRALDLPLAIGIEGSVRLSEGDMPMPDVFLWAPIVTDGPVPGDRVRLVIEIASTSLVDDLGYKRRLYAAGGIPEYWVVDIQGRAIHQAWAPTDGLYGHAAIFGFGETIRSTTLEGVVLSTAALR